jgi:hypothetical protein
MPILWFTLMSCPIADREAIKSLASWCSVYDCVLADAEFDRAFFRKQDMCELVPEVIVSQLTAVPALFTMFFVSTKHTETPLLSDHSHSWWLTL